MLIFLNNYNLLNNIYIFLSRIIIFSKKFKIVIRFFLTLAKLEGTKKPDSVCDVMFYGANSPPSGTVKQPNSALLWNVEGRLTCSYFFVPGANQSLELSVSENSITSN